MSVKVQERDIMQLERMIIDQIDLRPSERKLNVNIEINLIPRLYG